MSQKYVIVHFIDKTNLPVEFPMSEWPLHITLLANFSTDHLAQLQQELSNYAKGVKPVQAVVDGEDRFGPNSNVAVSLIRPDDTILNLHRALLSITTKLGVVFDEPIYNDTGYRPHATIQLKTRLLDKQSVNLVDFTLVDMFPGNDISRRRVLDTFSFGG